jgi:hypothetical protein
LLERSDGGGDVAGHRGAEMVGGGGRLAIVARDAALGLQCADRDEGGDA